MISVIRMKKIMALTALVLMLSLGYIQLISAQTAANPAVPEFTAKYVSAIYNDGALVQNSSLVITIINQPFTPFTYKNGFTATVFYDIQIGYHLTSDEAYSEVDGYPAQVDSNYTTITLPLANNTIQMPATYLTLGSKTLEIDSPVSIQVQTRIGYIVPDINSYPKTAFVFRGELSEWSSAQTITLNQLSDLPSPSVPEFSWLVVLPLLLSSFSIALLVGHRKTQKA
jgi:hypothetical protein